MSITRRTVLAGIAATAAARLTTTLAQTAIKSSDISLAHDPLRPQFHLLNNRGWMNDPCGPIYWRGHYHMFYQYNPHAAVWGDMHWAHAVSPDMVHWQRLPIALAPTPGGPDADGCFTGSAVVYNGVPTIVYTGVKTGPSSEATLRDAESKYRETQCLATATDDSLRTWKKLPQPVIPSPPAGLKITGFRDPAPWRDGESWYMVVASGIAKQGGMVLLYHSDDLRHWEYLHPLTSGKWSGKSGSNPVDTGEMWECPDFFPLGNKHILIHSTEGKTLWQSGELDKKEMVFHPERTGQLDYGSYYAPKTQLDAHGNRILWGWIQEARPAAEYDAAGWAGMMSLPRLLSLDNGELRMQPATQVSTLRGNARSAGASAAHLPNTMQEVLCTFTTAGASEPFSFQIGDRHGTLLEVRSQQQQDPKTIRIDDTTISLSEPLPPQAELHVFIDNSVMEIFIDRRYAVTRRFYNRTAGKPAATITLAGAWRVASQQAHSMKSIWSQT